MKKILLMIAFFAITAGISAQDTKKSDAKVKQYVVMKDSKMMLVREGKTTAIDKEMTFSDGTRVMSDGKVMMKDGSTRILQEGETLSIESKERKSSGKPR